MASISVIKKNNFDKEEKAESKIKLIIKFFIVRILLGLVDTGGGFLIILSLVFFAKLDMKTAVGTSLVIIAANTLIGFLGDLTTSMEFNWNLLILFTVLALIGIFIGIKISKFIDGKKLKPIFEWFVLVMGIYIIVKELILN